MSMPSGYHAGYERARAIDPDVAARYIAHTTIGDPAADALTEALSSLDPNESRRILQAAMDAEDPADLRGLGRPVGVQARHPHVPPELEAGARRDGGGHAED